MNVKYNNTEINVSITNIDVLEAINGIEDDIGALKGCKAMSETISCLKNVESKVKSIVENSGGNFSELFPKRDYIEYMKFTHAVVEVFNKADFKDVKQ